MPKTAKKLPPENHIVSPRWRNSIVRHDDVAPASLTANPLNPRQHPKPQALALSGVLDDVGWIAPVIVNEQTGKIIDGHLRVELAQARGEVTVPVTYVDLTEAQEAEALATFDPIGAMAMLDAAKLDALLREVTSGDAAVQAMLSELAKASGIVPADDDFAAAMGGLPDGEKAPFQQMTFTVTDRQADRVRAAVKAAKGQGTEDTGNENSNGNALAHICEAYLGG